MIEQIMAFTNQKALLSKKTVAFQHSNLQSNIIQSKKYHVLVTTKGSEKNGTLLFFLQIFYFLLGLLSIKGLFQEIHVYSILILFIMSNMSLGILDKVGFTKDITQKYFHSKSSTTFKPIKLEEKLIPVPKMRNSVCFNDIKLRKVLDKINFKLDVHSAWLCPSIIMVASLSLLKNTSKIDKNHGIYIPVRRSYYRRNSGFS